MTKLDRGEARPPVRLRTAGTALSIGMLRFEIAQEPDPPRILSPDLRVGITL